ncbi:MAG: restriction endonuclease subunit S [Lachnospiraceae bacterium]
MREMKDSGVEWIGEIPADWSITRIKYIGQYINGYAFKPDDWSSQGKPIIRIQDLTGSNSLPNFCDEILPDKYLIKNGDILVSWAATLDVFMWKREEGWLNQHIFKAIPNCDIIVKNFFFWLIKVAMENMNHDNKHGIVMQHVTLNVFNNFSIPIPLKEVQRNIGNYLDDKCSRIDTIIDKQRELIAKLKVYKQSIITETVTKGLKHDVELKGSGIEFIGEIPSAWKVCRLRNIGVPQNGISKGGEFFGHGYPFVSYGDVYRNYTLPIHVDGLIDTTDNERKDYSVEKGDIFFTRTSETIEEVGFSCVCEETIPNATFAGFVIRVRPFDDTLYTGYSKYYFRSSHHRAYLVKEMNLVTRASLGQDLLKSMPVLIPPMEEQRKIAEFLDEKCSAIDDTIKSKQKIIDKITAYKKSLIYEAVTGKKEELLQ